MGLKTDSEFVKALRQDTVLMEKVGNRLYGTAIPLPDEDALNAPVPYLIVTFDSLTNQAGTKDDRYESSWDEVNISVEVAGKTLSELHELSQRVRKAVRDYFLRADTKVEDYHFSAQAIQYDSLKPCYFQLLSYRCDVYYDYGEDEEDQEPSSSAILP